MEKYIIVHWNYDPMTTGSLEERVNEKINEGYFPIGGVTISDRGVFYQAMILRQEIEKEEANVGQAK